MPKIGRHNSIDYYFVTHLAVSKRGRMTSCVMCASPLRQVGRGRRRRYCSRSCQARAYRARRAATPVPAPGARPARLTTVGIARVAVELADRLGIECLSMRRLASELGVATAALYRYFPDRDGLLAAMTELVLADTPAPRGGMDWRARLRHEARQEWSLYRRHPWMLRVLARSQPPAGPVLFDIIERSFAAVTELRMTRYETLATYLACSGLVQGLAMVWSGERTDRLGGAAALTGGIPSEIAELLDPVTRPAMHRVFAPSSPALDVDYDELLDTMLDLLLDGIAARSAAG